jgi:hypothetical protein
LKVVGSGSRDVRLSLARIRRPGAGDRRAATTFINGKLIERPEKAA